MRHGVSVRRERKGITVSMSAWTRDTTGDMDISSISVGRLTVDDAEELAQALLSECQDIRRQEMAEDAIRYEEQVQHGQS